MLRLKALRQAFESTKGIGHASCLAARANCWVERPLTTGILDSLAACDFSEVPDVTAGLVGNMFPLSPPRLCMTPYRDFAS